MLQNAYLLANIGADTAENEQHFAEILPKFQHFAEISRHGGVLGGRPLQAPYQECGPGALVGPIQGPFAFLDAEFEAGSPSIQCW